MAISKGQKNDGTKEDLERALDALLTTLDTTALGKG